MNSMENTRTLRSSLPCKIEIMDMRGTTSHQDVLRWIEEKKTSDTPSEIRIGNRADITTIVNHFQRNCRGAVGTDYGTQSLEKADYIIAAKTPTSNPGFQNICGFVSLTLQYNTKSNDDGRSELYIDLICTPENNPRVNGRLLLKHVEDLAIYLKCSRIKLSSLDLPFCFYARQGFKECDDACAVDKEGECAPSSTKISLGDSDKGWRMTKCTKPTQLNETNAKIKAKTYNIPRKCKL